jgi:hypothetical protein
LRPDDYKPVFVRATKGYEARQMHFNKWLTQTDCEYMLLLDGDMIFPEHTLERLRSHGLPYISGTYLRRTYAPPAPVWFEDGKTFPFKPFTDKFEEGKLYKIGASGWGCILIHRDVAEAVQKLLKGEPFVIEDDMDVYPYDLQKIMLAIDTLEAFTKRDVPSKALTDYVKILRDEIRPLRGVKDTVGSDIRFPYFAKQAGFDLWLDTGVMCGHMLNYQLHPNDYINTPNATVSNIKESISKQVRAERKRILDCLTGLEIAHIERDSESPADVKTSRTRQKGKKVVSAHPADERGGSV